MPWGMDSWLSWAQHYMQYYTQSLYIVFVLSTVAFSNRIIQSYTFSHNLSTALSHVCIASVCEGQHADV